MGFLQWRVEATELEGSNDPRSPGGREGPMCSKGKGASSHCPSPHPPPPGPGPRSTSRAGPPGLQRRTRLGGAERLAVGGVADRADLAAKSGSLLDFISWSPLGWQLSLKRKPGL